MSQNPQLYVSSDEKMNEGFKSVGSSSLIGEENENNSDLLTQINKLSKELSIVTKNIHNQEKSLEEQADNLKIAQSKIEKQDNLVYLGFIVIVIMVAAIIISLFVFFIEQTRASNETPRQYNTSKLFIGHNF
ncbi:MAG: hypothetical protein WC878_01035 [Candidatus Paceibacterota bacterium]|jgi:ATP-dependent Zn protease